jgi:hypothetical protein
MNNFEQVTQFFFFYLNQEKWISSHKRIPQYLKIMLKSTQKKDDREFMPCGDHFDDGVL